MSNLTPVVGGDIESGGSVRTKINVLIDLYNKIAVSDGSYNLVRVDPSFIKAAVSSGKFLSDDGSYQNPLDNSFTVVFDTNANFTASNLVTLQGFILVETDDLTTLPKFKVMDGITAYNDLPYYGIQSLEQLLSINGSTGGYPFNSPDGQQILTLSDSDAKIDSVLPFIVNTPELQTSDKFSLGNGSFFKKNMNGFELGNIDDPSDHYSIKRYIISNPSSLNIIYGADYGARSEIIQSAGVMTLIAVAASGGYDNVQLSADTFNNCVMMSGNSSSPGIVGVADYSANYLPFSFIQKVYFDAFQNGLKWKFSCRASTTAALSAYTPTGTTIITANSNGILPNQDGITLIVGDRLLVKNEVAGNRIYNGGYIVTSIGSLSTPWILTRVSDANTSAGLESATWTVREGTIEGGRTYSINVTPIVIGTTEITFALTQGPGTYLNGTYLSLASNVFDINFSSFTTDNINEGISKLFFTNARAISSVLTAYAKAAGTVSPSDTILQAIQKLDGNLDTKEIAATLIDYSSTSTYTGWSSFTTQKIFGIDYPLYTIWTVEVSGTSDSALAYVTIPVAHNAAYPNILDTVLVTNNGVNSATGRVRLDAGGATISWAASASGGGFSTSGTKTVRCQITIYK